MILKQLLWAYSNKPCLTSSISLFDKASGLAARKGKWHVLYLHLNNTGSCSHQRKQSRQRYYKVNMRVSCLCSRCNVHHIPGSVCPWQPPPREHWLPKSGWRGRRVRFCVCTGMEDAGRKSYFHTGNHCQQEMTPIPYVILKVLAFMIIFSLQDMRTTHLQCSF